jgi:uncharacterized protein (DUF1697 family)
MPRYAAFLRGVSPMNAKMPQLKAAFEAAGFTDVKTVLSSGNVVFTATRSTPATLERKAESGLKRSETRRSIAENAVGATHLTPLAV